MDKIVNLYRTQTQKDIYELKQLLTVEKLRAYRRECALNDLDKELAHLELAIKEGVA
jgi:hypothetical protein